MKLKFRLQRKPRELRDERVAHISEELSNASAVILFTSRQVTHQQFEELRRRITPLKARLRFVKNTLFRKAAEDKSLPTELYSDSVLFEQTGAIFVNGDDVAAVVKIFVELFKDSEGVSVKIGWIDGSVCTPEQVKLFATLPTKAHLYAQLARSIQSPLQRLRYGLSYDLSRLVIALKEVSTHV